MALENLHLGYRISRFFFVEYGIVEKVEDLVPKAVEKDKGISCWKDENGYEYLRDRMERFPTRVTFRNPLGELIIGISPKDDRGTYCAGNFDFYKRYTPGDKFP